MAEQLIFDWPVGVALGAEDFFIAGPNAAAYAMVSDAALWPKGKLALIGPDGSGKSHLARVAAGLTGAQVVAAGDLAGLDLPRTGLIVEDLCALPHTAEEPLFHLHNHLAAHGLPLLVTATTPPGRWNIALPDLASRLQAMTTTTIAPPDDALLAAVMMKQFADRQVMPPPAVIDYLINRIERSYAAARDIVARIDAAAMAERRKITVSLCRAVLDKPATSM